MRQGLNDQYTKGETNSTALFFVSYNSLKVLKSLLSVSSFQYHPHNDLAGVMHN